MPALRNPRLERFAQLLAGGKTPTVAYVDAGYKHPNGNSCRLAHREDVVARVDELQAETLERERATATVAAERAAVTRQSLIEKAEEIREAAMEAGQFSAATAALREVAGLAGLRIERLERGGPGEFDWVEKLSTDQLKSLVDGTLDITSFIETKH
jgi:phage terminase small subunit